MLIQKIYPVEFPVGVQSSPLPDGWQAGFRVAFLTPVERLQVERLTSLVGQQALDLPARALTPICFPKHALKSPSNLLFHVFSGLAWQAGETSNSFNAIFNKRYVLHLQFLAFDLIGTKDAGKNDPDC